MVRGERCEECAETELDHLVFECEVVRVEDCVGDFSKAGCWDVGPRARGEPAGRCPVSDANAFLIIASSVGSTTSPPPLGFRRQAKIRVLGKCEEQ